MGKHSAAPVFGERFILSLCAHSFDQILQSAVVQESLRISPPVPGALPRVVPPQGVQYGSHFLPGGVSRKNPIKQF